MQATAPPVLPYAEPAIIVQPREERTPRYMGELESGCVPLLAGDGSIRTPIRVAVSDYFCLKDDRQKCLYPTGSCCV